MSDQDYIKSIDQRLGRIEMQVCEINAKLASLRVKVAGISAAASGVVWIALQYMS